jgi:hypothetical protein
MLAEIFVVGYKKNTAASLALLQEKPYNWTQARAFSARTLENNSE